MMKYENVKHRFDVYIAGDGFYCKLEVEWRVAAFQNAAC